MHNAYLTDTKRSQNRLICRCTLKKITLNNDEEIILSKMRLKVIKSKCLFIQKINHNQGEYAW